MAKWQQIADHLSELITDGSLQPGSLLPGENQLAAQYEVSRETIRKALKHLEINRKIIRRRGYFGGGGGTFIRHADLLLTVDRYVTDQPQGPWETACEAQGIDGTVEMTGVETIPADPDIAELLAIATGTPVLRRNRRMLAGGEVRQIQTSWMPAALVEGTALTGPGKIVGGVYTAMRAHGLDVRTSREKVQARLPSERERLLLELQAGTAVIEQSRVTFLADGTPIEAMQAVAAGVVYVYDVPVP